MASAITPTVSANQGISGYMAAGFSDQNWLTVARNVQLANGGADVYALGTKIALGNVLPAQGSTSSFRYGEDGAIVKTGYLPAYKGVPMVELGNALVPNTINGQPQVIVADDVIYMINRY